MRNVPVLDLLAEATGLEVRVFGHIMRDAKSNTRKWAVPPSPPEVEEFNVAKIPLIVVLKKDGEKMGEISRKPAPGEDPRAGTPRHHEIAQFFNPVEAYSHADDT